jgi:hypothetical protein
MTANRTLCLVVAATFLVALFPRPAAAAVCQDYGGFPNVGGTRVCVTDNGKICTYKSEPWGISGGCEQS